ncbi:phosphoribosylanthranilate isomerase [Actibacterium sp. 188UL27-1]|uniref:phosphoribosylanthranilate isomerase n=1 Tax=Actibacterium sp. 188UL27-1 TaxID=2786961 RepID=UPI00195E91D9|nr:phosphoribosylanthranilate isomerase [Actibacterium sp. 188UL27-1]MBM7066110.1 phosphoribosylanthranilate isomerase [Actibacterium sp. 188UL27-1]
MARPVRIKICGLTRPEDVSAVTAARANYVGFVFFPKSPRNIGLEAASQLAIAVPAGIAKVALVVNADNAFLDRLTATVPLDMLQLHGNEPPERVLEVRQRYGLPVMKALGVRDESDLPALDRYARVADQLLVDAKPPEGADRLGGNGVAFDWRLIAGRRWPVPWMLAGGLTIDNVAEAMHLTDARQVDLSSGVESAPGVKDPDLIRAFCEAARGAIPAAE